MKTRYKLKTGDSRFPETSQFNLPAKVKQLKERRASDKVAKQSRKRNRRK